MSSVWLSVFLLCAFVVDSSHFRYMTLYWYRTSGTSTTIRYAMQQGWRYGMTTTSGMPAGQFSSTANQNFYPDKVYAPNSYTIAAPAIRLNLIAEYLYLGSTTSDYSWRTGWSDWTLSDIPYTNPYTMTRATQAGMYQVARVSFLRYGADAAYAVYAGVSLVDPALLSSPRITGIPVVTMGLNRANNFYVPVSHSRNWYTVFSLTQAETGMTTNPGTPGATCSTNGLFSWTPTVLGWYATQIKVKDELDPNCWSVYDFMVNVVDYSTVAMPTVAYQSPFTSTDPRAAWTYQSYDKFTFSYNFQISITMVGDPGYYTSGARDNSAGVAILNSALPVGSTLSGSASTYSANGANIYRTLTWTPTARQVVDIIFFPVKTTGLMGPAVTIRLNVIDPPPIITAMTPTRSDTSGTTITLTGRYFGVQYAVSSSLVSFNNLACSQLPTFGTSFVGSDSLTYDVLTCVTPAGSGTNIPVTVTVLGLTSNIFYFNFNPPTISSFSPSNSATNPAGITFQVLGTNFGVSIETLTVTIGGFVVGVTSCSYGVISGSLPYAAGKNLAVIVNAAGQSVTASGLFNYDSPVITGLAASDYPTVGGTVLTLYGNNFAVEGFTTTILVNGVSCPYAGTHSHNVMTCTLPAGQGTVSVTIQVLTAISNSFSMSYSAPRVTSSSPVSANTGPQYLTLTGENFGGTNAVASATVGGVTTAIFSRSQTQMVLTLVDTKVSSYSILVIVNSISSPSYTYTFASPVLTSLSSSSGGSTSGGATITLTGTSFGIPVGATSSFGTSSRSLTIGGVVATITASTPTAITFTLPMGQGTGLNVALSVDGVSATNTLTYSYAAPTVSSFSPTTPPTSSSLLTISGANFGSSSGSSVTVGGISCPQGVGSSWTNTQIICVLPEGNGGTNLSGVVTVSGQTASFTLSYASNSISSISSTDYYSAGGGTMTISGINLGLSSGNTLSFGGAALTFATWSQTSITASVPEGYGTKNVYVVTGGRNSNTLTFTYQIPTITAVTANSKPTAGNVALTLTGVSFDTSGSVTVGGSSCPFTSWSHTQIICTLPAGQGTVNIVVTTTHAAVSSGYSFSYDRPTLTSFSPSELPTQGGTLLLSGTNFGASSVSNSITIGVSTCTSSSWSQTSITCTVAPLTTSTTVAAGHGTISINIGGSVNTAPPTLAITSPTISGITGSFVTQGSTITVNGSSFGAGSVSCVAWLGPTSLSITSHTHTQVLLTLPEGQGSADIVMYILERSTNFIAFSYNAPIIVSASPNSDLAAGQLVTMTGLNFGLSTAGNIVTVGSYITTISSYSHTSIVFAMPNANGLNLPVQIALGSLSSNNDIVVSFSAPTIISVTPSSATTLGGTTLTINGTNFGVSGTVSIGVASCTVVYFSSTLVRCTTRAGSGANWPVVVTTSSGAFSNSLPFSYFSPRLDSVTPASGSTSGVTITIAGQYFSTTGLVHVDNAFDSFSGTCAVQLNSDFSDTQIVCLLPQGYGTVQLSVEVSGQLSNIIDYAYALPVLSLISPASGTTAGGISLILTGTNFGISGSVFVGGVACPMTGSGWSHTRIECSLPAGQGADQAVYLTSAGTSSNQLLFDYSVPHLTSITCSDKRTYGNIDLTISGTNLGPDGRTATVTVGGVAASISYKAHTTLTATLPPGSGSNTVVVTVEDQTADNTLTFVYAPPTVSSIAGCSNGFCVTAGNILITIVGTNLAPLSRFDKATQAVVWWTFDGTISGAANGQTLEDFAGDLDGTIANGVNAATFVFGEHHLALDSGLVTFPAVSATKFGDGSTFTISLWLRASSSTSGVLISHAFDNAGYGWQLLYNSGNTVTFTTCGSGGCLSATSSAVFAPGAFCSLIVSKSGTTVTFYGIANSGDSIISAVGSGTVHSTFRFSGSSGAFALGVAGDHSSQKFDGRLDDVAIFNRVLAASERTRVVASIFGASSATVNSNACVVEDTLSTDSSLVCLLPAGTGYNLPVSVNVSSQTVSGNILTYQVPTITANTLTDGSTTSIVTVSNMGGTSVSFQGIYFPANSASLIVRFTDITNSGPLFACSWTSQSTTDITCSTARGFGGNLRLQVYDGLQWGPLSADSINFAKPIIAPNSLRLFGAPHSSPVSGLSSLGDHISFDVQDASNYPIGYDNSHSAYIQVFYGQLSNPTEFQCTNVAYTVNGQYDSVSCYLEAGDGTDFVFVIRINGIESDPSIDTYNYPQAPTISSISGCSATVGSATAACPTEGGTTLSIAGNYFPTSGVTVYVDGSVCPIVIGSISTNNLQCILPAGMGAAVPVYIRVTSSNPLQSRLVNWVSYGPPEITSISGCVNSGSTTTDCNRQGGNRITILGNNFGASGGSVLICGAPCTSIVHISDSSIDSSEHHKLSCVYPQGTQLNIGVTMSLGGQATSESGSGMISYAQCAGGYFQASDTDYACTACDAGTYTEIAGQTSCEACLSGRFQGTIGSSSCAFCPAGKKSYSASSAVGPTICDDCTPGYYTLIAAQTSCFACEPGTYQPASQQIECISCAVGTASDTSAAVACLVCSAGRYAQFEKSLICDSCTVGKFSAERAATCIACSPGYFQAANRATRCDECPVGTAVATSGQAACIDCDPGAYANQPATTTCTLATPGYFAYGPGTGGRAATDRTICPIGQITATSGLPACSQCRPGAYASSTGLSVCILCAAGTISSTNAAATCTDCLEGTFAASVGLTQCTLCAAGFFAGTPATTDCQQCELGYFAATSGLTVCSACTPGSFTGVTATVACTICDLGSYATNSAETACYLCVAGRYAPTTATVTCLDADLGNVVASAGESSQVACEPGYYAATARATRCLQCTAGKYQGLAAQATCLDCVGGTFSPVDASVGCTSCSPGYAHNLLQQTACPICVAGTYAASSMSLSCSSCLAGTITDNDGLSQCSNCPTGKYAETTGMSICSICAPGSYQDAAAQSSAIPCPVGYYQPSSGQPNCIACEAGRFASQTGSTSCVNCAAGSFSNAGANLCTLCDAGKFSSEAAVICLACIVGKFANETGTDLCSPCPAGYVSGTAGGATECTACPQGSVQPLPSQGECVLCPAGFQNVEGQFTECIECQPGYFAPEAGWFSCSMCPLGRFSPYFGSIECNICTSGSYALQGQTGCTQCLAGSSQPENQQVSCTLCNGGTYSPLPGAVSCLTCPAGTFATQGASVCTSCTVGHYCTYGADDPSPCALGSYQASLGQSACSQCPVGYFGDSTAANSCSACSPGQYASTAGTTQCVSCVAGYYAGASAAVTCSACSGGSYTDESGSTTCLYCLEGTYQPVAAATICLNCRIGRYAIRGGSLDCIDCEAGRYADSPASPICALCAVGTFSNLVGATLCNDCFNGTYSDSQGSTSCKNCALGSYGPDLGMSACLPCESGSFGLDLYEIFTELDEEGIVSTNTRLVSGAVECQQCPFGSYQSSAGQSACIVCEAGKFNTELGAVSCTLCPEGTYQSATNTQECIDCPSGRYMTGQGAIDCLDCPFGEYSASTRTISCARCGQGTYNDRVMQTDCTDCQAGRYMSGLGAAECSLCAPGYYTANSASVACSECVSTTYQSAFGSMNCLNCPAGRFGSLPHLTECTLCEAGKYQASESSSGCIVCSQGRYQTNVGQIDCVDCAPGTFTSSSGFSVCTDCSSGTYNTLAAQTDCAACIAGKFQDMTGQTGCSDCPISTANAVTGVSSCASCIPGSFGNTTGLTQCYSCTAGSYQSDRDQTQCISCEVGRYQPGPASVVCIPCDIGKYQPNTGASLCTSCSPGRYQGASGSIDCVDCPAGRASNLLLQVECEQCAIGTYQNVLGTTSCEICSAGKFQSQTGQVNCENCPEGKFGSGGASCTYCVPGRFGDQTGLTACLACPTQTFSPDYGLTSCIDCVVGKYGAGQGVSVCENCPYGKFTTQTGVSSCTDCAIGTFAAITGLTSCESCVTGKYLDSTGQRACLDCPRGKVGIASSTTSCQDCDVGTYQSIQGQLQCDDCEPGTSVNSTGATSCLLCVQGRFQPNSGTIECVDCPIGSAQSSLGQPICLDCESGTYSANTGSIFCVDCPKGFFSNNTGLTGCQSCLLGTYSENERTITCTMCDEGKYVDVVAQTSCAFCPVGTFQSSPGNSFCDDCLPGTYAGAEGFQACDLCSAGTFQPGVRSTVCEDCGVGTFGNSTALTICRDCEAGSYQSQIGQEECALCETGKYSTSTRSDQCEACPAGSFANTYGNVACSLCDAGKYNSFESQVFCLPCEVGTRSAQGEVNCVQCPDGTVAPFEGTAICTYCDVNARSDEKGIDCLCNVGYAMVYSNSSDGTPVQRCDPCPVGAVCNAPGIIWDSMAAATGFWQGSDGTYYQCLLASDCVGGSDPTAQCGMNRAGALCATCLPGYTISMTGDCEICATGASSIGITILAVLIFLVVIIGQYWFLISANELLVEAAEYEDTRIAKQEEAFEAEVKKCQELKLPLPKKAKKVLATDYGAADEDGMARYSGPLTIFGPPAPAPDYVFKLKIMLGFIQIMTNIGSQVDIHWPTTFINFLYLFDPANLDFMQLTNADCLNSNIDYFWKMYAWAVLVPFVVLILGIVLFVPAVIKKKGKSHMKAQRRHFWRLVLFTLFLVYPSVSTTVLGFFVCKEVDGVSYLKADFTVICSSEAWNQNRASALALSVIYPFGIPLAFFCLIAKYKWPQDRLDLKGTRSQMGFLYDGYKRDVWYFELCDMAHKLVLTSCVAFIPIYEWQMPAAMIAALIYLSVIYIQEPYVRKGDDRLHITAQVEMLLLFLAGHVFNSGVPTTATDEQLLAYVLIAICVCFFAWWVMSMANVLLKVALNAKVCNQCIKYQEVDEDILMAKEEAIIADPKLTQVERVALVRKMRNTESIKINLSKKEIIMLDIIGDEMFISRNELGKNAMFQKLKTQEALEKRKAERRKKVEDERLKSSPGLVSLGNSNIRRGDSAQVVNELSVKQLNKLLHGENAFVDPPGVNYLPPPPKWKGPYYCEHDDAPPSIAHVVRLERQAQLLREKAAKEVQRKEKDAKRGESMKMREERKIALAKVREEIAGKASLPPAAEAQLSVAPTVFPVSPTPMLPPLSAPAPAAPTLSHLPQSSSVSVTASEATTQAASSYEAKVAARVPPKSRPEFVVTLSALVGKKSSQMTFGKGDIIQVVRADNPAWHAGVLRRSETISPLPPNALYYPANYVKKVDGSVGWICTTCYTCNKASNDSACATCMTGRE